MSGDREEDDFDVWGYPVHPEQDPWQVDGDPVGRADR